MLIGACNPICAVLVYYYYYVRQDTPFWRSLPPTDPRQNKSGPSSGNNLHFYPPIYPEPGQSIRTTHF